MVQPLTPIHDDAFRFNPVVSCYIVRLRAPGVLTVYFNLLTGAIEILNKDDLPALKKQFLGKSVCLNRNHSNTTPMDIYQEGILRKLVGKDVFYLAV